jgi:hypothetical protein
MQRGARGWARAAIDTADRLLERREPDVARRLEPRERRVERIAALLFVVVAVLLLIASDEPWPSAWTVIGLVVTYAVLTEIRLPTRHRAHRPHPVHLRADPLPGSAARRAAARGRGELLGEVRAIALRRAHPERALVALCDSWYSVGPALVVAAFAPSRAWYVFVLALAAQFATDFAATAAREGAGTRLSPARLAPVMALIYTVDSLLTPVGVLVVLASPGIPRRSCSCSARPARSPHWATSATRASSASWSSAARIAAHTRASARRWRRGSTAASSSACC